MRGDQRAAGAAGPGPAALGRAGLSDPQHVLEMPAPVVADALGYHPVTTAKRAAQAAGTWSRYGPGGHLRSPSVWNPGETHDS